MYKTCIFQYLSQFFLRYITSNFFEPWIYFLLFDTSALHKVYFYLDVSTKILHTTFYQAWFHCENWCYTLRSACQHWTWAFPLYWTFYFGHNLATIVSCSTVVQTPFCFIHFVEKKTFQNSNTNNGPSMIHSMDMSDKIGSINGINFWFDLITIR